MPDTFAANASALGYFYQARYALLLLLDASPDAQLTIERFDDVAFEDDGDVTGLLQLKHHISNTGSLTDASVDLWKTLRIWSIRFAGGISDSSTTSFTLITTAAAPEGSAASYLRPTSRDISKALDLLRVTADTSNNQANETAYSNFKALTPEQQTDLISSVFILDASPNIIDVEAEIKNRLRLSTRPKFLDQVFTRLEGWWFRKTVMHLADEDSSPITYREILEKLNDIQEQYHQDNLPIEFLDVIAPEEDELSADERIFILQLRLVAVGQPRVRQAINDYYRAFEQRSKWMREDLLGIGELETYENRLVDEWSRRFEIMKEELVDGSVESGYQTAGRALFNYIDTRLSLPIRERCTEPYVMRGSYHMLANTRKVGWHALFLERLSELLAKA